MSRLLEMASEGRLAFQAMGQTTAEARSQALMAMAKALKADERAILEMNEADLEAARQKHMPEAQQDRLRLNPERIAAMVKAIEDIALAPDPVGQVLAEWTRPNGLKISKISTSIGLIAMIYESRPNVTADASALIIRSGNVALLRSGSEALATSLAIHKALQKGLASVGFPTKAIQMIDSPEREIVGEILGGLKGMVDLIIPRGGKSLVARVQSEARAPVLAHLEGINHSYVHHSAVPDMAIEVIANAKMRRVSVCGATETVLIDQAIAPSLLPPLAERLRGLGCELRGDAHACALVEMSLAKDEDWSQEYLAPILSIKIVADIHEAIDHIAHYGTQHTEAILAQDEAAAETFLQRVDSAIVMWNASTQFADGGEFGMGAEIGIATGRLHARGPVGAAQLTTFKYQVRGEGQIRP